MKEYDWIWITMMDRGVCEDCKPLSGKIRPLKYWAATGKPRQRGTRCGSRCRCILIPDLENQGRLLKKLDRLTEQAHSELAEKMIEGIKVDRMVGGVMAPINLKEFEQIKGIMTLPFAVIAKHEKLVARWKQMTNGKTLPKDFYALADVGKQIDWLEKQVR